jgi:GT2 family glycosyltransferase
MSADQINLPDHAILIICINYNNDQDVQHFVAGVLDQKECAATVVVVDNTPRGNNPPLFDWPNNPRILVYNPKINLGYFGGAWWGLQHYLLAHPWPKWIIVANPDIHFPDNNFFQKLNSYYHNEAAVIGPDIILETTDLPSSPKHQNPHLIRRPSKFRMHLLKLLSQFYPIYLGYEIVSSLRYGLINKLGKPLPEREHPCKIYAPFGAFIIFHRSFFLAGGTLDYGCLIYGEEFMVAETARRLNLTILYDPRLKVIHAQHGSIRLLKSKQRARLARESLTYCIDSFFVGDA